MFDYKSMSAKTLDVLSKAFGPNAAVGTDDGEHGKVFVRIVSDKFDGRSPTVLTSHLAIRSTRQLLPPDPLDCLLRGLTSRQHPGP